MSTEVQVSSASVVPLELVEIGWRLVRDKDAMMPYRAKNDKMGLYTEAFVRSGDAIERARELTIEAEEEAAIAEEGSTPTIEVAAAGLDIPAASLAGDLDAVDYSKSTDSHTSAAEADAIIEEAKQSEPAERTKSVSYDILPLDLANRGWTIEWSKIEGAVDGRSEVQLINETLDLETDYVDEKVDAIAHARELTAAYDAAESKEKTDPVLEDPRKQMIEEAGGHDWRKSCLVGKPGGYDTYRCELCGADGKRYGVSWPPVPDKKKFSTCPQAAEQPEPAPASESLPATDEESVPANFYHVPQLLDVDDIRTDGGTQPRAALDMLVVNDYKELMVAGRVFPAVDVFYDGTNYWLADGFHRYRATQAAEITELLANVHQGTQRDAILFSLGANATHGLPRSPEDKRRAVMVLLNDQEWATWSDRVIADKANVSHPFVGKLRRELTGNVSSGSETLRKTKDNRVIDTTNIGSPAEEDERQSSIGEIDGALPEPDEDTAKAADPSDRSADIVGAMQRHGDALTRGQLEEMGFNYNEVLQAVGENAITQIEIGKFALPEHKPQSSPTPTKSEAAAKQRASIEETLKGRMLTVSFTWIPGVKGKVNVTINTTGKPENAMRKMVASESVRGFAGEVMDLITEQLDRIKVKPAAKPPQKKAAPKSAAKKAVKAPAKKAAKKTPAKKKPAAKKGRKK